MLDRDMYGGLPEGVVEAPAFSLKLRSSGGVKGPLLPEIARLAGMDIVEAVPTQPIVEEGQYNGHLARFPELIAMVKAMIHPTGQMHESSAMPPSEYQPIEVNVSTDVVPRIDRVDRESRQLCIYLNKVSPRATLPDIYQSLTSILVLPQDADRQREDFYINARFAVGGAVYFPRIGRGVAGRDTYYFQFSGFEKEEIALWVFGEDARQYMREFDLSESRLDHHIDALRRIGYNVDALRTSQHTSLLYRTNGGFDWLDGLASGHIVAVEGIYRDHDPERFAKAQEVLAAAIRGVPPSFRSLFLHAIEFGKSNSTGDFTETMNNTLNTLRPIIGPDVFPQRPMYWNTWRPKSSIYQKFRGLETE